MVPAETAFSIEVPDSQFGHYATNVAFSLAQKEKKSPRDIAVALIPFLKESASEDVFESIKVAGAGFINFTLTQKALAQNANEILSQGERYGGTKDGAGKTVIVEYSQPNVAKKMHVGHLRTTIIGDALANIYEFLGYKVIRWNYIGDWGTQYGKLIAAYKLWRDELAVQYKKDGKAIDTVEILQELYVMFHKKMKSMPELKQRGQEEFKKLEEGDAENRKMWKLFRRWSLDEFEKAYRLLGVRFDTFRGESDYEKELKPLIADLERRGIAEESQGTLIVRVAPLPPALIRKSDGASLYLTRDIANLQYRIKTYHPVKILYVVGNEQSLHFEQLFAIARRMGIDSPELVHVKYGLVLSEEGKKLSTREGRVVLLEDVMKKAITLAKDLAEKSPVLTEGERTNVAQVIGVSAVKYNDLSQGRAMDTTFNWERMLSLKGDSAPYLQYTYARLRSVLRKSKGSVSRALFFWRRRIVREEYIVTDSERAVLRELLYFPFAVREAGRRYEPHQIANYLHQLANTLNSFYESSPVLSAETHTCENRLALVAASAIVLKNGLHLLGIETVEKM